MEVIENDPSIVARLHSNVAAFRTGLADLGFDCTPSPTAIIPIMIGDEAEAIRKSARLFELGVLAIGFAFPVVPRGEARIRVQVSAALTDDHVQQAMDAFAQL
jgi:glycine C-acetyltransferase